MDTKYRMEYMSLHPALRLSLDNCFDMMTDDEKAAVTVEVIKKIGEQKLLEEDWRCLSCLHIKDTISVHKLLLSGDSRRQLYAYSSHHDQKTYPPIKLNKIVAKSKNVVVCDGKIDDRDVIIKVALDQEMKTEAKIYEDLESKRCSVPWTGKRYYLMDYPVVVMEKLRDLTHTDDPYEMAIQILDQLYFVHKYHGVHCDIKPDNILAKDVDGKTYYYLIDFGGCSRTPLDKGFIRDVWTRDWASQRSGVDNQLTTASNDFEELMYVTRWLQICNYEKKISDMEPKNYKKTFTGRLARCMELIRSMGINHDENMQYNYKLKQIIANSGSTTKSR